ncbi:unnamed protein product (macronuclear) [Paramecium tetraurelia]|uniref:Uncharacterized protein n=1 Tax=Paramecium tetraurelia TaxID=5888 RepID=A0DGZ7_PARTE|nr:uncharacterized protein GSPATT00002443001 [Paramecium tetraurelia]CAK82314.1 unnamed protein product [Paramecium tetraurelia]|eukprot:XP_001449711.1 hypothetical protein (macronuclear) [Paramecium tetraurelia strain d4-2]
MSTKWLKEIRLFKTEQFYICETYDESREIKISIEMTKLQLNLESKDTQNDLKTSMKIDGGLLIEQKKSELSDFYQMSSYVWQTLYRRQSKESQQSFSCMQNQKWNRRGQINYFELMIIKIYIPIRFENYQIIGSTTQNLYKNHKIKEMQSQKQQQCQYQYLHL